MTGLLCIAASSYAVHNPSQMSKRGSSGRLSARTCAVLSPVSRVPHSSSSGMCACLCLITALFSCSRTFLDVELLVNLNWTVTTDHVVFIILSYFLILIYNVNCEDKLFASVVHNTRGMAEWLLLVLLVICTRTWVWMPAVSQKIKVDRAFLATTARVWNSLPQLVSHLFSAAALRHTSLAAATLDCTHHSYCCAWEVTLSLSDTLIVRVTYLLSYWWVVITFVTVTRHRCP